MQKNYGEHNREERQRALMSANEQQYKSKKKKLIGSVVSFGLQLPTTPKNTITVTDDILPVRFFFGLPLFCHFLFSLFCYFFVTCLTRS